MPSIASTSRERRGRADETDWRRGLVEWSVRPVRRAPLAWISCRSVWSSRRPRSVATSAAVRAYARARRGAGLRAPPGLRPRARRRSRRCTRRGHGPVRRRTRRSTSRSCCSATWPAITSLELVTGIIILPQRQTALVAKQAAEVDLLTDGRFRLGVGLGWNAVEYEALGKDFTDRGRRMRRAGRAAAPAVDRAERSRTTATYEHGHRRRAGAAAGAAADPGVVRRAVADRPTAARDGWPTAGSRRCRPARELDEARGDRRAGRSRRGSRSGRARHGGTGELDRAGVGRAASTTSSRWRAAGATHSSINTMNAGLGSVDDHLAALSSVAVALGHAAA